MFGRGGPPVVTPNNILIHCKDEMGRPIECITPEDVSVRVECLEEDGVTPIRRALFQAVSGWACERVYAEFTQCYSAFTSKQGYSTRPRDTVPSQATRCVYCDFTLDSNFRNRAFAFCSSQSIPF